MRMHSRDRGEWTQIRHAALSSTQCKSGATPATVANFRSLAPFTPHPHPHPHSHSTGSPHMEHEHLMSMLSPHEEEEVLRAQGLPIPTAAHLCYVRKTNARNRNARNTDELRKKLAGFANGHGNGNGNGAVSEGAPDELIPGLGEHSSTFVRKRQRKLSQSNTAHPSPEQTRAVRGCPPPTDTANNLTSQEAGVAAPPSNTGHDRPYRFSFYSNRLSATIHARSLSELPADGQTFEELERRQVDAYAYWGALTPEDPAKVKVSPMMAAKPTSDEEEVNTWWLDVLSPTNEEMAMLSKCLISIRLRRKIFKWRKREKRLNCSGIIILCVSVGSTRTRIALRTLSPSTCILSSSEGILSFHFRGTPHPQNVRRRIKQLKDYISVTSDWISYALIDDITDAFGPLIQGIEYEVDSIDELVLILKDTDQSDMLRRKQIGTCRKKVMGLLRLMGNKADVVKGLAKRCNENWSVAPKSDIVGLYLSDIQDHLITMTQNLNHYEKILSRSHSNYLAQISIEMTDANNQINDVLSKLTALGTVLIPMNLVTGLWGMNVHVPGEDLKDPGDYRWFISIIGGLVGFGIIGSWLTYKLMRNS
ncbi:CorA-like magnesium transporter protein [Rhizoctonia solani]|uniref:CorA-like magnesium transporter protein n=1 Tax=Rhizoctonia solani TaxID=456999 RepID=A0A8H8SSG3_9AGAM|nr:CorA-like magnesium transporter protein [Rhizoctonia solani]QRW16554.1 CorA-like magnesium transporter protein [Rhizoctonia solani]